MGIGIVSRKIPSEKPSKKKEKKEPEKEEKTEEKESKGFKLDEAKEFLHLGWNALPHLKPILTGFIDSINLENFVLRVEMGFESSVDNEFLMGCLWAVAALMTISISVAPSSMAIMVSKVFVSDFGVPNGKPTTTQIPTSLCLRKRLASAAFDGVTHEIF